MELGIMRAVCKIMVIIGKLYGWGHGMRSDSIHEQLSQKVLAILPTCDKDQVEWEFMPHFIPRSTSSPIFFDIDLTL